MLMFIWFLTVFFMEGLLDPAALPPWILLESIGVNIPFWNWALCPTIFCSAFCEVITPGGPVGFTKLFVSMGSSLRLVDRILLFSATLGSSFWLPPPLLPLTFYSFGIQGPLLVY